MTKWTFRILNGEWKMTNVEGNVSQLINENFPDRQPFAYQMEDVIVIPRVNAEEDSILTISQPKKKRIRVQYEEQLENEVLIEKLKELKALQSISQSSMKKIVSKLKKVEKELQKELQKEQDYLDHLIEKLEDITKTVVNEKEIKDYVAGIHKYYEKLLDSISLENPEILDQASLNEVLQVLYTLKSYLDEYIMKLERMKA